VNHLKEFAPLDLIYEMHPTSCHRGCMVRSNAGALAVPTDRLKGEMKNLLEECRQDPAEYWSERGALAWN
jgi:hypothetical protein